MRAKELLISMGILLYFFCTFSALSYTLFRRSPVSPRAIHFFYGMMGPYQQSSVENIDIAAEGKTDQGTWVAIDLYPYFLPSPSERVFQTLLLSFRTRGMLSAQHAYDRLAAAILAKERMQGRQYTDIRLFFEQWPASPGGFSAMRIPIFTERIDPLNAK